ncbi:hypothetical protein C488_14642 [Natrinema pellirubrum DSM 15624]|uniref:Uncharacterized protein n=1 Tax=Natrinema pellirubrum (strain DSM 15624 / CIP 106293 / JCM 10476 / NCIMB 786 / 157) TaxID=797303 RepID=L0JMW3_NATP1|nr:hypothetical protein [Natrinema pellirubrum]AGB31716.1 hypothetical protein Natpe_1842 [Natrinema pellirubrum DSM 15624]ELY72925.1 hypothetical protein C488_14642 [Natrinema pellirubrum DSM 15624]
MSAGLDLSTGVIIFGWIPFWWAVALITLYRMRKNDERAENRAQEVDAV